MTALRASHAVWLQRRASMLAGNSPDAGGELPDPGRATQLNRIATKVVESVDRDRLLVLTPDEHALLVTEAHALGERVEEELRRPSDRNLSRAELWVMIARALREIVEATG
jgi:hypothetical protein